jgi:hypothetical protein
MIDRAINRASIAVRTQVSQQEATMIDDHLALMRAHRSNINRYQRLLRTRLSEFERQYIERRLSEERSAMDALLASTFPIALQMPSGAREPATAAMQAGNHG